MLRITVFVVAIALLTTPVCADDIVLVTGKTMTGVRITSEDYQVVEYRKPGVSTPQKVPAADVASVRYERSSKDWRDALVARDGGDLDGSIRLMLSAAGDDRYGEHQQARALIEAAEAMVNLGFYQEAIDNFDLLLAEHPTTRHLGRALLGKGKAALRNGDFSMATATFDALETQAAEKGLGERWPLEAQYFALRTEEGRGDSAGLAAKYGALKDKAAGKYTGLANKCGLRVGKLKLAEGQNGQARRLFDEIVAARLDTDRDVIASAYNGRGRARVQEALQAHNDGDAQESRELFRQALLDFLRVYVHYGDVRQEQPEALYWAAQCYSNLTDLDDWQLNSRRLLHQCKTEYAQTHWGEKAAAELR